MKILHSRGSVIRRHKMNSMFIIEIFNQEMAYVSPTANYMQRFILAQHRHRATKK